MHSEVQSRMPHSPAVNLGQPRAPFKMTHPGNTVTRLSFARLHVAPGGLVHPRDRQERTMVARLCGRRFSLLISSRHIRNRIAALGRHIAREARLTNTREISMLVVLKGAFFFGSSLASAIFRFGGPAVALHFVSASSYGNATRSRGQCRIDGGFGDLKGKNVLIVDDICDTGLTLRLLKARAYSAGAAAVRTCVMLDKPTRRRRGEKGLVDVALFEIPGVFAAGCGLDFRERFRALPCVIAAGAKRIRRRGQK